MQISPIKNEIIISDNPVLLVVRYIAELEDERKRRLMRPRDAVIGVVSKF